MKKLIKMLFIVSSFLFTSSLFAKSQKIGFVNMQKAIELTTSGKASKKQLEREYKSKKKSLESTEASIKKEQADFEKKKAGLSEKVKQDKYVKIQQKIFQFQQSVQKSEAEIRKKEQQLTEPIVTKLKKAIEAVKKKENFNLILHDSEQIRTVLSADKDLDLTNKVVKKYESMK